MMPELVELHGLAEQHHERLYNACTKIRAKLEQCSDVGEQVDAAYALRETFKLIDDARKQTNALKELAEKLACLLYIREARTEPVRTEHATASPRLKMAPVVPSRRKDPAAFRRFCVEFLNIPEALVDVPDDEKLPFDVYWPGVVEKFTKMMERGEPLPAGMQLDQTYPVYSLNLRQKKGVSEA